MEEIQCPRCEGRGDIKLPSGTVMKCNVCGGRGVIDQQNLEFAQRWTENTKEAPKSGTTTATKAKSTRAKTTTKKVATPRASTSKSAAAKAAAAPVVPQDNRTPLHQEASDGFTREVKRLIEEGADVNARDDSGRTPLHWPAYRGHIEVVQMLLDAGADVNARDNSGRTPLKMANVGNHSKVIELLKEHGGEL